MNEMDRVEDLTRKLSEVEECLEQAGRDMARVSGENDRLRIEIDKMADKIAKYARWEKDEIGVAGICEHVAWLEGSELRHYEAMRGQRDAATRAIADRAKVEVKLQAAERRIEELEAQIFRWVSTKRTA